ncbi:DUF438 domain-containing protein [Alkalibacter saccharofermentans]|uniref:PAC domain-containing protein n=1 Tax=Alkalibacter saccharofermentans DSM 14828 TaxID=1120975 RepID=A0A1M4WN88_9FIRM|nr:DUF438 domain-containing protein [Alkalibacter saccharofermentans]SHE82647.1 hypothetical protein SAMN02746064_01295 [Alkalibacter saccharofermentans DSM 14828]
MSEHINNREQRQKLLKQLILELHEGKDFEEVKQKFEENFKDVSATEITEMETQLVKDGLPVEEIQKLCDVHASVFKGTIDQIHKVINEEDVPGHPVHTFRLENKAIEKLLEDRIKPHLQAFEETEDEAIAMDLIVDFNELWKIDVHYSRKENLIFPYMEKYDITAPPKVMWGVDDEIRRNIRDTKALLYHFEYDHPTQEILKKAKAAISGVEEMIFKEENILFPMILEKFNDKEWQSILEESDEFGYVFVKPIHEWKPKEEEPKPAESVWLQGQVQFDAGFMLPEEINAMLNVLPVDITFVDKNGKVKYFSQGKERIFARPKTIIGREVKNCHPPSSVHIVEKIVEDLKSGKKDHEDFWINFGDKFVLIKYFAVRDADGEFLGVVEVSQDVKPIQELQGEKRLAD